LPIRLIYPALSCFPKPKSKNLSHLVLISSCLARDARESFAKRRSRQPRGRLQVMCPILERCGRFPKSAANRLPAQSNSPANFRFVSQDGTDNVLYPKNFSSNSGRPRERTKKFR
jgi:hypothetical protein